MIYSFWKEHLEEFFQIMKEHQYCDAVIKQQKGFANFILKHLDEYKWQTYDDVIDYYNNRTELSKKYRWRAISAIKKMKNYHLHGIIPIHHIDKNHYTELSHSKGDLDFYNLQENLNKFISCYEKNNYSKNVVYDVKTTTNRIIVLSKMYEWNSYQDIKDWFASTNIGTERFKSISHLIDQIELWNKTGEIRKKSSVRKPMQIIVPSLGELDFSYLQEHLDEFLSCLREQGYSEISIENSKADISRVIILARTIKWNSVQEIKNWYSSRKLSYSYVHNMCSLLDKFEHWAKNNTVPEHPSIQKKLKDVVHSVGKLDLTFLQEHVSELLKYMEEHGYGPDYRKKVYFISYRIIVLSRTIAWDSYDDILEWYSNHCNGERYLYDVRSILGILAEFHLKGIMPNNRETQNPLCLRENAYSKLITNFQEMVDFSCDIQKQRGLKDTSVDRTKSAASNFLYYLQSNGIISLDSIKESDVIDYFFCNGKNLRGQKTAGILSLFLRECIPLHPVECRKVLLYLPVFHTSRKNIQYLTMDELSAFHEALNDPDNNLSLKSRAIASLVYYTGMRSSDIANLKVDSIDLRHQTICFDQIKTEYPVVLPLSPVVGNVIFDYCVIERPKTDNEYLFIGDNAPYNRLHNGGISWAVENVMKAACIRQNPGDRKGTHIFRHRAVSTMASQNIPTPVISATVGHSSPQSLDAYLYTDMVHMRDCALALDKYPISKEVFSCV